MRLLLDYLKRRRPLGVGIRYVLAGAVLLVLANLVLGALGAPPWVLRLIMAGLVMAFPFVVVLTWAVSAGPPSGVRVRPRPWDVHS